MYIENHDNPRVGLALRERHEPTVARAVSEDARDHADRALWDALRVPRGGDRDAERASELGAGGVQGRFGDELLSEVRLMLFKSSFVKFGIDGRYFLGC